MLTYFYQANGKIDEGMTVATKVRTKDELNRKYMNCEEELKVLKASLRDTTIPKDWDRIVGYYYPFYPAIMERLLQENGHALPIDIESKNVPNT